MVNNVKHLSHQLKRPDIDTYRKLDKAPIILILDNIRSAINVGSIMRSADAFNIEKIFLCGITAAPPNKEVMKSALGASESVEWEYVENTSLLVKTLKNQPMVKIISIEQTQQSISLNKFYPQFGIKNILILGNEIEGVEQDIINLSDQCIEIPQFGTKHSLNVAVSAGIVLWDFYSKIYFDEINS